MMLQLLNVLRRTDLVSCHLMRYIGLEIDLESAQLEVGALVNILETAKV